MNTRIGNITTKTGMVPVKIKGRSMPIPGHHYWCSYWGYAWLCTSVGKDGNGLTQIKGVAKSGEQLCHGTLNDKDDFELTPFTFQATDDISKAVLTGAEWRALLHTDILNSVPDDILKDIHTSVYEGYGVNDTRRYRLCYNPKLKIRFLKRES